MMIFIPIRRKWNRTLSETKKYCVVHHVFGKWYIVRNLLKNSPKSCNFRLKHILWRFMWWVVNEDDFQEERDQ